MTVNCARFEERLDDYLDGKLSEVEQRAAEAHETACTECAALAASLRETLAALGPELALPAGAPPDLAADIVARTSGPACGRVQSMLTSLVDGTLPGSEADLVHLHLGHCPRCATLHRALAWLEVELPQLALIEPALDLTDEIVAATSGLRARRAARRRAVQSWFQGLVARPRFAWEFAYVATVLLVLLFGSSLSPLKDVPSRALAMIQVDPRPAATTAATQLRELHGDIGAAGSRVWDGTAGRVADAGREASGQIAERHPGMRRAWQNLQQHSGEARRNLGGGNFASAGLSFTAMAADVRALWHSWRASAPGTTTPPN
jgi:anti-sigma factor RsiW